MVYLSTTDGDEGLIAGSCPNRAESLPMNATTVSLVLENYFPTNPNSSVACMDNSAPLISMTNTCFKQDGKRWPNFIAVDFYRVSSFSLGSSTFSYRNCLSRIR